MNLNYYKLIIKRKIQKAIYIILSKKWIRAILLAFWQSKKINLGDTNRTFFLWGWKTADIRDADYTINFHKPILPLIDESIKHIYSSHMIEHISDTAAQQLFNESFRILQKGGSIRIVCPDLDKIINAYKNKNYYFFLGNALWLFSHIKKNLASNEALFLHNNVIRTLASYIDTGLGPVVEAELFEIKIKNYNKYDFAKWCVSLLDKQQINNFSNIGHINAYDYDKIESMLKTAGFKTIYNSERGMSEYYEYRNHKLDDPRKEWISLYVEAVK